MEGRRRGELERVRVRALFSLAANVSQVANHTRWQRVHLAGGGLDYSALKNRLLLPYGEPAVEGADGRSEHLLELFPVA